MPWTSYAKDPDDAIHDWLRSQYTPYRNGLGDPSVLPLETDIEWDTYFSGLRPTSFTVLEDITTHMNRGLGVHNIDFEQVSVVRSTVKWVKSGKPSTLKQIREFVTKTLHTAILNGSVPAILKAEAGIFQMLPLTSRIMQMPSGSAQSDHWVLEVRVATKVYNSVV